MNKAQFTAYALGQLPEAERQEVEKQMDREEAKQLVRDAERLGQVLRTERAGELLPDRSTALIAAIGDRLAPMVVKPRESFIRHAIVPAALAATLLLSVVAVSYWYSGDVRVAQTSGLLPAGEGGRRPDEGAAGATLTAASPSPVSVAATETPSPGGRGVNAQDLSANANLRLEREAVDKLVRQLITPDTKDLPAQAAAGGAPLVSNSSASTLPSNEPALTKSGAGMLMLNGSDVYTGGTTVNVAAAVDAPSAAPALAAPSPANPQSHIVGGTMGGIGGMAGGLAPMPGIQTKQEANNFGFYSRTNVAQSVELLHSDAAAKAAEKPKDAFGKDRDFNTEAYDVIVENPFVRVADQPLSTFSIDVDTASYANMRRFLMQGQLPPPGAVRIEELINYFTYDYPQPSDKRPFSVAADVAACPWNEKHRLVRIGLKGREIDRDNRPASNLVFLLDVSGSMQPENKLPLVKRALQMLVEQLTERDHVAIVVYAGASGLVLPSTTGNEHKTVLAAIERLEAGGSTNGASGLQLAYDTARQGFITGGTNRVILCTDGDFNVGITNQDELVRLIEKEAKSGVFLSALGFGMGNYKDSTLEKLADKGNGNYGYIDNEREARKLFVEQMTGTLVTIAKDVKIQIEFNPARVGAFRLLGYENRILAHEDFNNDKKDAGEIGAGHTVTALYEVAPVGEDTGLPGVDPLKYQAKPRPAVAAAGNDDKTSNELLTVKLRYKEPEADNSQLIEKPLVDESKPWAAMGSDYKFAASVAAFGMLLRGSEHAGTATYATVLEWATEGKGADLQGYRGEFIDLVRKASTLQRE